MELTLTSFHKDLYPKCGFFIEDSSLNGWLEVLHRLGLDPSSIEIHGLPSKVANQIWGCLALTDRSVLPEVLGKCQTAHTIGGRLIIPEKSTVIPELTVYDCEQLFKKDTYVLHPDFGLLKLTEPVSLDKHIDIEAPITLESLRPKDYLINNGKIKSFSVESTPKEELKLELESTVKREKFEDKPLSFGEKLRLKFYEKFVVKEEGEGEGGKTNLNTKGSTLEKLAKSLGFMGPDAQDSIMEDFRNLQERNKKEIDKLMALLDKNPEEALRYAIPLEEHGYTRGHLNAEFKMQDRGFDFSLFNRLNISRGTSGSVDMGDEYFRLRQQYLDTAKSLKEKGVYEKAAYIYFKLLKDYDAAAATLREGKHYQKAALIFLEYVKNEQLAAECYEEGKIYEEAIELYKNLGKLEKTGDLYLLLGNRKSANDAYQAQIDKYLEGSKYLNASKISKEKMLNLPYAQELLMSGWKNRIDQYSCLRNYLENISDAKEVWGQIDKIYKEDIDTSNDTIFFKVLKDEYAKQDENETRIKDLAYKIISKLLEQGRISSHELMYFNKENVRLKADIMRYELKKNKRVVN